MVQFHGALNQNLEIEDRQIYPQYLMISNDLLLHYFLEACVSWPACRKACHLFTVNWFIKCNTINYYKMRHFYTNYLFSDYSLQIINVNIGPHYNYVVLNILLFKRWVNHIQVMHLLQKLLGQGNN